MRGAHIRYWMAAVGVVLSLVLPAVADDSPITITVPTAKYVKATPEEAAEVDDFAAKTSAAILQRYSVQFTRLETPHFQIYTDWSPSDYSGLKREFETAYSTVSNQFNIPSTENIFLGKLPCFVFSTFGGFAKFSKDFVGMGDISPDVQGYYGGNKGFGYMCVYKPQDAYSGSNRDDKIRFWEYVLTHEMTHAFVARYVSNRRVTTWLNEGIAEVVASSRIPRNIHDALKEADKKYKNFDKLFADNDEFRSPDLYPVMNTMVQVLVHRSKTAFIKMFGEIKAGKPVDQALMDNYHWTYAQLEAAWRQAVKNMP